MRRTISVAAYRTSTMEPADIFGPAAASHIPIMADVLDGIGEHKYQFMSPGEFGIVVYDHSRFTVQHFRASGLHWQVSGSAHLSRQCWC